VRRLLAEAPVWKPESDMAITNDEWPEPLPLPSLPDVEPFSYELLPDALRPSIQDISERMQCPPDFPAVGVMVALSSLVGRQLAVRPKRQDDWEVCPNLWGVAIGRPGLMKSPALQFALKPLAPLERHADDEFELAQRDYEALSMVAEAEEAKRKTDVKKAIKSGRDVALKVAQQDEPPPAAPSLRRYRTNDPTVEKLGELLNENPNGLLLFRDELLGFLRSFGKDGREGDRDFYKEAWSGNSGSYHFDRIQRGHVTIESPCVSVLGTIQPGPWSEWISRAARGGLDDDGLIQRFQLAVWPDDPGEWRDVDRLPNSVAMDHACDVFRRLDSLDLAAIEALDGEYPRLPYLRFGDAAQSMFTDWRAQLERSLRTDEKPELMQAHLSKYRSLVPSIALLCHLVDEGVGPITKTAVSRAIAWAGYLESHANRIYSPAISSDIAGAKSILRRIQRGDLGMEFPCRDLQRKGWSVLGDRKGVEAALELLEELGWLRQETRPTRGRPSIVCVVNPRADQKLHSSDATRPVNPARAAEERTASREQPVPTGGSSPLGEPYRAPVAVEEAHRPAGPSSEAENAAHPN
jgi:putative DNA primase/helicase